MTDPNAQDALKKAPLIPYEYAYEYPDQYGSTWHIGTNGRKINGALPRAAMALFWGDDVVRHNNKLVAEKAALVAEVERLREALEYALAQHEQPGRFSPMHNHWSAKAHAALSTANSARIAKARE